MKPKYIVLIVLVIIAGIAVWTYFYRAHKLSINSTKIMTNQADSIFNGTPPLNGLIFQSGGVVSPWYAFVVNFDTSTIQKYSGEKKISSGIKSLTKEQAAKIIQFAKKAVSDNFTNMPPQADVDFKLEISNKGVVESTETFGPLPQNGNLNDLVTYLNSIESQQIAPAVSMAYSFSYATLDPAGEYPNFKHTPATGMSWATLVIPLQESAYLITKFSMPVLPDAHFTQDSGSTYLYADGKFTPWSAKLTYSDDGSLKGDIQWTNQGKENTSLIVGLEPKAIMHIDNASQFVQIQKLPGFEKATYHE